MAYIKVRIVAGRCATSAPAVAMQDSVLNFVRSRYSDHKHRYRLDALDDGLILSWQLSIAPIQGADDTHEIIFEVIEMMRRWLVDNKQNRPITFAVQR